MPRTTLFFIAMLCCVGLRAQISPTMINKPDAPLQFVSITSNFTDFLHGVTLKNVSNKPITSFQLGIIMSVPTGCGPTEAFSPERRFPSDRVGALAPGQSIATKDYGFSPKEVLDFTSANLGRIAQTQLAIVHVEFFDGTSWNTAPYRGTYDIAAMRANAELHCSNSTKAKLARAAIKCTLPAQSADQFASPDGSKPQTFKCVASDNQVCAVAGDGQSCTASFCTGGCPSQTCCGSLALCP